MAIGMFSPSNKGNVETIGLLGSASQSDTETAGSLASTSLLNSNGGADSFGSKGLFGGEPDFSNMNFAQVAAASQIETIGSLACAAFSSADFGSFDGGASAGGASSDGGGACSGDGGGGGGGFVA